MMEFYILDDDEKINPLGGFIDSPHAIWIIEVINNCWRDTDENKAVIDINLLSIMVKSNPKKAQVAMQLLAEELDREGINELNIETASGQAKNLRLLIGSIYIAYLNARSTSQTPMEIELIILRYPSIIACANYIAHADGRTIPDLLMNVSETEDKSDWSGTIFLLLLIVTIIIAVWIFDL